MTAKSKTAFLLFAIAAASALSVGQAHDLSGRQTGSWARPETERIFVDALRRHFPGGTIKELPHHINDAAFADVCVAELAGLLSQKNRSVRHFVLFAFPATRAAPQMR
jgi:hypothetical protein